VVTGQDARYGVERDKFIVSFRRSVTKATMHDIKAKLRVMHELRNLPQFEASVDFEFKHVVKGFACMLSPFALKVSLLSLFGLPQLTFVTVRAAPAD